MNSDITVCVLRDPSVHKKFKQTLKLNLGY